MSGIVSVLYARTEVWAQMPVGPDGIQVHQQRGNTATQRGDMHTIKERQRTVSRSNLSVHTGLLFNRVYCSTDSICHLQRRHLHSMFNRLYWSCGSQGRGWGGGNPAVKVFGAHYQHSVVARSQRSQQPQALQVDCYLLSAISSLSTPRRPLCSMWFPHPAKRTTGWRLTT